MKKKTSSAPVKLRRQDAGEMKLAKVPLVTLDKSRVQSDLRNSGIDVLVASMGQLGQLEPILVTRKDADEERYIIVNGHHRVAAAEQLGWTSLWAVIDKADQEVGYVHTNGSTQRMTDRQMFDSWAKSANPDLFLQEHIKQEVFVRDVRLCCEVLGKKESMALARKGVCSPSLSRHARSTYNAIHDRLENKKIKVRGSLRGFTEAAVLRWGIKHHGACVFAAGRGKVADITGFLRKLLNRILKDEPFPQDQWPGYGK